MDVEWDRKWKGRWLSVDKWFLSDIIYSNDKEYLLLWEVWSIIKTKAYIYVYFLLIKE